MATVDKQLLSRLTHHVRNPFNGIIGFSDLLANHFEKLDDDDKKNYIQIVHQLSKKALLRSENLAWWLKFFTENITPVPQNVDLSDLIKDELNYFNTEIEKQHLDLALEINDNAIIKVDKVMLQSVLKNLLLNIIEFAPVGEYVLINLTKDNEQTFILTLQNVCTETPSDEVIDFLNSKEIPNINNMPNQPGLWTVRTLCTLLEIPISATLINNQFEVKLRIPG
jgi:two-component system sensor histidine kinase/response regulator